MEVMTIGMASNIASIHPSSLRRWEAQGYIKPQRLYLAGQLQRIYSWEQVQFLKRVKAYLDEGYGLRRAFELAEQDIDGADD